MTPRAETRCPNGYTISGRRYQCLCDAGHSGECMIDTGGDWSAGVQSPAPAAGGETHPEPQPQLVGYRCDEHGHAFVDTHDNPDARCRCGKFTLRESRAWQESQRRAAAPASGGPGVGREGYDAYVAGAADVLARSGLATTVDGVEYGEAMQWVRDRAERYYGAPAGPPRETEAD